MSYTISYGQRKRLISKQRKKHWGVVLGALILSVAAFFVWWLPEEAEAIQHRMFPWTQPQVRAAFEIFTGKVAGGESLREAFGEFCLEIINEEASFSGN